ncbi:hypothetical protein PTTG_10581, partial [Puccinia triticina 1-1 BBBD Race 1]
MSLPFTNFSELEDGFAPQQTPSRNRLFDTSTWNEQNNVPPPPQKDKGKAPADQYREQEVEDGSDTDTPQNEPLRPKARGYGMHNVCQPEELMQQDEDEDEPVRQREAPRIIKDLGLFYDGSHFMKFLTRYERIAQTFQATDYNKALQIGRFVRTEQLKCELEEMDGYKQCNWKKLRKEMVESWGELDDTVLYTTADL